MNDITTLPEVLTAAEARLVLRISLDALYEGCRRGRIPHVRVGAKLLRFSKQALTDYINGKEVTQCAAISAAGAKDRGS